MTYQDAVTKLTSMANGEHVCIEFQTSIYDMYPPTSRCKLYRGGPEGYWTQPHLTFDAAFTELEAHINGTLPGITDEAPTGEL